MLEFIDGVCMWAMEQGVTFALKWIERLSRWLDGEPFWGPSPSGLKLGELENVFAQIDRLDSGEYLFVLWNNDILVLQPDYVQAVIDQAATPTSPRQVFLEAQSGNVYGLDTIWWEDRKSVV